ncbi:MAG: DNA/RNA non-specific endonuclease [Muribaculum sp.]|nr:DNA/RNA non-specific endonuclease [Muribaculum sp.]
MKRNVGQNNRGSVRQNDRSKYGKKRSGIPLKAKAYMFGFVAVALVVAISAAGNLSGCSHPENTEPSGSYSHIAGLDRVVTEPGAAEYLVDYTGMNISFNPKAHVPNWVAWELTADEAAGTEPRSQKFVADESVPGCAEPWDYSYSGYDRGHMAPAGDMKWSKQAMNESFYMTNICPQLNALNSGAWRTLEEKCRVWAMADSAIVIVAGPILSDKLTETIGDSHVVVPQRFFKVILSPYSNPPRGIGFIMNNGKVAGGMQKAAVSIDEVEAVTGHDFFSALSDEVENAVEAQCNFNYWSTLGQ